MPLRVLPLEQELPRFRVSLGPYIDGFGYQTTTGRVVARLSPYIASTSVHIF